MAKFELNIYGENDEILKKYETGVVRWGVFLQAIKLQEEIKDKSVDEQFVAINSFIKKIFNGLTDEELELADGYDIINTFNQLTAGLKNIRGGNAKNA